MAPPVGSFLPAYLILGASVAIAAGMLYYDDAKDERLVNERIARSDESVKRISMGPDFPPYYPKEVADKEMKAVFPDISK